MDLGTKIKNYCTWVLTESNEPYTELEWLVNLVLDDAPTRKKEMIDALETINEHIKDKSWQNT